MKLIGKPELIRYKVIIYFFAKFLRIDKYYKKVYFNAKIFKEDK